MFYKENIIPDEIKIKITWIRGMVLELGKKKKEVEMWDLEKEVDRTSQISGEQQEERGQIGLPGLWSE